MVDIKSSRHSKYLVLNHMVWIPKYRRAVLNGPLANRLKEILRETVKNRGWEIVAVEVMPDHVHLFVSVPPTVRPAEVAKTFKGVSARKLLLEFPDLQRRTGRGRLWAPSYYVSSAGRVSAETVRRYIEGQREKERKKRRGRAKGFRSV